MLNLRSVAPLDRDTLLGLAERTGRVVVVDEDYVRGGFSGEIAATLLQAGSFAAVRPRRGRVDDPVRSDPRRALPNSDRIIDAVRGLE